MTAASGVRDASSKWARASRAGSAPGASSQTHSLPDRAGAHRASDGRRARAGLDGRHDREFLVHAGRTGRALSDDVHDRADGP